MGPHRSKKTKKCDRKSIKKCPDGCRVNKKNRKCVSKLKKTRKAHRKKVSRKTLLSRVTAVPGETIKVVRKLPGETVRVVTKLPGKTANVVKVVPRVAVKGVMTGVKALESVGVTAIKSLPGGSPKRKRRKTRKTMNVMMSSDQSGKKEIKRLKKKADKGLFDSIIEDAKTLDSSKKSSSGGKSSWTSHVNDVWKKGKKGNKNYKFKQAMSDASKSWKKQVAG